MRATSQEIGESSYARSGGLRPVLSLFTATLPCVLFLKLPFRSIQAGDNVEHSFKPCLSLKSASSRDPRDKAPTDTRDLARRCTMSFSGREHCVPGLSPRTESLHAASFFHPARSAQALFATIVLLNPAGKAAVAHWSLS